MKYYSSPFGVMRSTDDLPYTEITEEEYNAAVAVIEEKREYTQKLYSGQITENEVPEKYRADVIAEVEAIREAEQSPSDDSVSIEEALSILLGGMA